MKRTDSRLPLSPASQDAICLDIVIHIASNARIRLSGISSEVPSTEKIPMGLLSVFTGNATEVSAEQLDTLLEELSAPGEEIEKAYQLVRDVIVFTNRRVILIDKQGVTGRKAEVLSIPYGKITKFSKESASVFDLDAELRIWVGSDPEPIKQQFGRSVNINEVYSVLSTYVLG